MISKKQKLLKRSWPLLASFLMFTSGCKGTFPPVTTAIVDAEPGTSQVACLVTKWDGTQSVQPIEYCNNMVCHSPRDYQKIIKWGRNNCGAQ